ncbi:MAG: extracellular solute-binding protein [Clostridiales bacterium]|nr:extracellular solute-binding protein [Clostridiales bacterium]
MRIKRTISLLLLCSLMLGLMPLAQAAQLPDSQDISPESDTWINAAAYVNGTLYLSGNGIYSYRPGEDKLRQALSMQNLDPQKAPMNIMVAGGEDKLYSFDWTTGNLYPMELSGDKLTFGSPVKLDISLLPSETYEDDTWIEQPAQLLIAGSRLFARTLKYGPRGAEQGLISWDLEKGGQAREHKAEFVQDLAAYKDGQLLALVLDVSNAWDQATGQMKPAMLAVYDMAADTLTEIGSTGFPFVDGTGGLVYDAANDIIYLGSRDEIRRRDTGGNTEVCAYLTASQYGGSFSGRLSLIGGDHMLVAHPQGVMVRSVDPARLPKGRLTIYGHYMDDVHQKTIKAMNGIPVTFLDTKYYATAQDLGQALVSGEDSIDIFVLASNGIDLKSLMQKGYCADLSGSQILTDYVASLYPSMQQTAQRDGKVFLAPIDLNSEGMEYYPKLLEEVGVEAPQTFGQLCDLIQRWNDELGEKFPDYLPMHTPDYQAQLLMLAMQLYSGYTVKKGEEFSFASPVLRGMLERAAKVDTRDIMEKVDWTDPNANMAVNEMYNKFPLISGYSSLDLSELSRQLTGDGSMMMSYNDSPPRDIGYPKPLLLTINEGDEPALGISLQVMAVNPKSRNLESAIAYVENYVKSMDPAKAAMLNPSLNEDILNPHYDEQVKWMEESKSSMEKALKDAQGAERTEMQAQYDSFMKEYDSRKEQMRYSVKEEAIAVYRKLMEYSFVNEFGSMMVIFSSPDMQQLFKRYAAGQIQLDQMLNEADGKLRLMRLEGR